MTTATKTTKPNKSTAKAKTGPKRAWKMTNEVVQKLETAYAFGATDEEAAFYAGISRATLFNYFTRKPAFKERCRNLQDQPVLRARQVVIKALENEDSKTAMWYLERKRKAEFSKREELTGADGQPLAESSGGTNELKAVVEELKRAADIAIGQATDDTDVADNAQPSESDG